MPKNSKSDKTKRELPENMKIRVELSKQIAKDANFTGVWVPIIKTISWITNKNNIKDITDSVKK